MMANLMLCFWEQFAVGAVTWSINTGSLIKLSCLVGCLLMISWCWCCTANFSDADLTAEPVLDVVLEPGDLLYFPRGYIHQVSEWLLITLITESLKSLWYLQQAQTCAYNCNNCSKVCLFLLQSCQNPFFSLLWCCWLGIHKGICSAKGLNLAYIH